MAREIDERIVEMRFDNAQFESKCGQTLSTLEKLKSSLDLKGIGKGFDELEQAASKVDMKSLGGVIDTVKTKFSALETVAVGALLKIGEQAITTGERFVRSIAIDPITQGFEEYELKMNSIQTIMASTGEGLKTVNEYLDELNTYADKTIYSFSDMTQNIGKFTNSGVKLENAVKAIQGISNEAAVSGANANEASRAMYNFAQALSAGYVKLIDWKSIELANMATVEFKNQLIDTAVAMGTVVKEGDMYRSTTTDLNGNVSDLFNATTMYNDSLAHQWLSTDVLVQALSNYSTDVRDMTDAEKASYEEKLRGIGYTEEQIKSIEELGKKAFDSAQDVKTFHQLVDTLKESVGSSWSQTFEILFGDFEESKKLWSSINNVVGEFINKTSEARNGLLSTWKELGGRNDVLDSITNSFEALYKIFIPIKDAFKDVFPAIQAENLLNISKSLKDFSEKLFITDEISDKIRRTFKGLFSILSIIKNAITNLLESLLPGIKIAGNLAESFLNVTAKIGDSFVQLSDSISKNNIFENIGESISKILIKMNELITSFKEFISIKFSSFDLKFLDGIFEKIKANKGDISIIENMFNSFKDSLESLLESFGNIAPLFSKIGKRIVDALKGIIKTLSQMLSGENLGKIFDIVNSGVLTYIGISISKFLNNLSNITEIGEIVVETFSSIQNAINAKTLTEIAVAIAILAAALVAISLIDREKITDSLIALSVIIAELSAVLNGMSGLPKISIGKSTFMSLIGFAASVFILALALVKISTIDKDKILEALGTITILLVEMAAVAIALSKYGKKVKTGAVSIIAFAASIYILTSSVEKLGKIDTEVLKKGLLSVGSLLAELAAFIIAAKFGKFKPTQAVSIVILAAALLILQKSVSSFGKMDINELKNGLSAVGAILAELAVFNISTGLSKHVLSASIGMLAIAAAITILQNPISKFAEMPIDQIGKALLVLGGVLAEVAIAMKIMPKNSLMAGIGLIAAAEGIIILNRALLAFSTIEWEEIKKGLIAMGLALGEVVLAANLMKGTIGASLAMIIFAAAINLLVPALKAFSLISWEGISKGLIALGGALAIIIAASYLLKPVIGTFLLFAIALDLISVAISAVLLALTLFASADFLNELGTPFRTVALEIIPEFIKNLANLIPELAPVIIKALIALIETACIAIRTTVPEIVDTLLYTIDSALKSLVEYMPSIVSSILELIIGIINSLAEHVPAIVSSLANLFNAIFGTIIDRISSISPEEMIEKIKAIGYLAGLFIVLSALSSLAPSAMAGVLALGVLIAELSGVLALLGLLMESVPGLANLVDEAGVLLGKVGEAIGNFIGNFIGSVISETLVAVSEGLPKIADNLAEFSKNLQPFITNIKNVDGECFSAVETLVGIILLLTAAEIISGIGSFMSFLTGGKNLSDFGKQISTLAPHLKTFADETNGINAYKVKTASEALLTLFKAFAAIPNSGGLIGKIFGNNDISEEYADNMVAMGKGLKEFSDNIKGDIDYNQVNRAAYALSTLFKAFSEMPNSGGILGDIVGNNDISEEYADNMAVMGVGLANFSKNIDGKVDYKQVSNSASALADLFKAFSEMPNSGGILGDIIGENNISEEYADNVAKMGKALSLFSAYVKVVDSNAVSTSATLLSDMFKIFHDIPNEGGVIGFFTGDNDIATFGDSLVKLGGSLSAYSNLVKSVNFSALSSTARQVGSLVTLEERLAAVGDPFNLYTFLDSLSYIGTTTLDNFSSAFADCENVVGDAVTTMMTATIEALDSYQPEFSTQGDTAGKNWSSGLLLSWSLVSVNLTTFMDKVVSTFSNSINRFSMQGTSHGEAYLKALTAVNAIVKAKVLPSNAEQGIRNAISGFLSAGEDAGQGFINGLNNKLDAARSAGTALGNAAFHAAQAALDSHSPSRKFMELGDFSGEGFVLGLVDWITKIAKAGTEMGDTAVESAEESLRPIKTILSDGMITDPVIRPTVDTSEVERSADEICRLFNNSVATMTVQASSISGNMAQIRLRNEELQKEFQNKSKEDTKGDTYNIFNQTNTSPKALSRIEIYRQTNNLFSRATERIGR